MGLILFEPLWCVNNNFIRENKIIRLRIHIQVHHIWLVHHSTHIHSVIPHRCIHSLIHGGESHHRHHVHFTHSHQVTGEGLIHTLHGLFLHSKILSSQNFGHGEVNEFNALFMTWMNQVLNLWTFLGFVKSIFCLLMCFKINEAEFQSFFSERSWFVGLLQT